VSTGKVEIESEIMRTHAYTASILSESFSVITVPLFVVTLNPSPNANNDCVDIDRLSLPPPNNLDNIICLSDHAHTQP
jgi:hypothetical protein